MSDSDEEWTSSSLTDSLSDKLLNAAQYGDIENIEKALTQKSSEQPDCNRNSINGSINFRITHEIKDWAGDTLLGVACWHGHFDIVELLLQAGADPNTKNNNLSTPLHRAAYKGDLRVVQSLIDHGADVTARDSGGRQAKDLADSSTRELLHSVDTMQKFEQAQQLSNVDRIRRNRELHRRPSQPLIENVPSTQTSNPNTMATEDENKILENKDGKDTVKEDEEELIFYRRKHAVNIMIRGAKNSLINGVYEPIDRHHNAWPVYSKRCKYRNIWLIFDSSTSEWLVQTTAQLGQPGLEKALLRILQIPENFPELRVQVDGIAEIRQRKSIFDWGSVEEMGPCSVEIITEYQANAEKANNALRIQQESKKDSIDCVGLGLKHTAEQGVAKARIRRSSVSSVLVSASDIDVSSNNNVNSISSDDGENIISPNTDESETGSDQQLLGSSSS